MFESLNKNKKLSLVIELAVAFVAVIFLVYILNPLLLTGETTLMHDHIYWGYPTFQFSVDSMLNGDYPFWNPFTHAGEPFYPVQIQRNFLNPILLLTIYIGQFLTDDMVMLYNWYNFILSLTVSFGVYIVFRMFTKHTVVRLSLIPILLYSSFFLVPFRQPGALELFFLTPYITYFLIRIVAHKDYRWHNWLILGSLMGITCQSYFFVGISVFLLFFSLGFIFFKRKLVKELIKSKGFILKSIVMTAMVLILTFPNVVLMIEKNKYVFPARAFSKSLLDGNPIYAPIQYEGGPQELANEIKMPYNVIAFTGTFTRIWDYIQIISPEGNSYNEWSDMNFWGDPTECYVYIGLLPWLIVLFGLIMGKDPYKKVWLLVFICFGFFLLGPYGGLHRFMYYVYPPLWFIRHTELFVLFFTFSLLYFYVIGLNTIIHRWKVRFFPILWKTKSQNSLSSGSEFVNSLKENRFIAFIKQSVIFPIINLIGNTSEVEEEDFQEKKESMFFSSIIFSLGTIISVSFMTRLVYPVSNFLFLFILVVVVVGWFFRKSMGRKGLFISLFISHIIVVLVLSRNTLAFLIYLAVALLIPLSLYLFAKKYKDNPIIEKLYNPLTFFIIFSIFSAGDLIYSFTQSKMLYNGQKHPKLAYEVETRYLKPILPQNRSVSPQQMIGSTLQSIRYISMLNRKPYTFSSPLLKSTQTDDFEVVLKEKRFNSFLLLKNYFNLIHSGIPTAAMKAMFSVDKPVFQFKKGALLAKDNEVFSFLKQLETDESIQLLKNYIFIDTQPDTGQTDNIIPLKEYQSSSKTRSHKIEKESSFNYKINQYKYGDFEVKVTADDSGFLYFSDGYDKSWKAYVNGKEVSIYRANINFKAIALSKGQFNIRFLYKPSLFITSLYLFYGMLIVSILGVVILIAFSSPKQVVTEGKES